MAFNKDNSSALNASMQLLTVSNKVTKPQDTFVFRDMIGVDKDGVSIRTIDMKTEFEDNYFVLFFFPMDFKVDSSEVLSFKEHLDEFANNNCEIVGVTSDSPWAVKRWIIKEPSCGGFGGPVKFPILCDKDLSLSMSMGVAMDNGNPARATFIIDWTGRIRYMMSHRSDIGRSVKEILRLVQAFRHSDLTGQALASGWVPGGEVIPTEYAEKVKYFTNKFGHGSKGVKAKDDSNKMNTVDKSGAMENDDESTKKIKAKADKESKEETNNESKEKIQSKGDNESKEKTNAKADDKSMEKTKIKVQESSVKDEASLVSVSTVNGPRKIRSDKTSPVKGKSGTPSDVSVAEKASLGSNKDFEEKRSVSVEKVKAAEEKK